MLSPSCPCFVIIPGTTRTNLHFSRCFWKLADSHCTAWVTASVETVEKKQVPSSSWKLKSGHELFFFFLSTDFWLLCQISKDFCKIRNRFWGRSWPLNELRVAQGRLYSPPILVNSTPASAYAVTQRLLYFAFFGVQGRVHFLREVTQVPSVTLFQTPPICSSKEELKIKKLSDSRASHISGLRKG